MKLYGLGVGRFSRKGFQEYVSQVPGGAVFVDIRHAWTPGNNGRWSAWGYPNVGSNTGECMANTLAEVGMEYLAMPALACSLDTYHKSNMVKYQKMIETPGEAKRVIKTLANRIEIEYNKGDEGKSFCILSAMSKTFNAKGVPVTPRFLVVQEVNYILGLRQNAPGEALLDVTWL